MIVDDGGNGANWLTYQTNPGLARTCAMCLGSIAKHKVGSSTLLTRSILSQIDAQ